MFPSPTVDFSAMLLAFGFPYAYFRLKTGQKMVVDGRHFAILALSTGAILLFLATIWQLAANIVIWILIIVALREF